MSQKTYDKEFKLNAVKLYLANKDNKRIRAVAEGLRVSRPSLGHWIIDYKKQGESSFIGSGSVINQELAGS